MIKCNVKLVGTLLNQPQIRKNKDNEEFITFDVTTTLPDKGEGTKQTISVAMKKEELAQATRPIGTRVQLEGSLTFHKTRDTLYLNMSATSITADGVPEADSITGEIEFRGTIGNEVQQKTDKNQKPYILFSAYSSEKVGDDYTYTWVSFLQFDTTKPDWMISKPGIHATGKLQLSFYKDRTGASRLEIGCTAKTIELWDKTKQ